MEIEHRADQITPAPIDDLSAVIEALNAFELKDLQISGMSELTETACCSSCFSCYWCSFCFSCPCFCNCVGCCD